MMLVHLPAMDNVPGFALVDSLPSFGLSTRLASFTHHLANPNIWLTFLATLVILSSIRAAVLFLRPPPSTARKGGVSIIPGVGVVQVQNIAEKSKGSGSTGSVAIQEKREEKKTSSMLWGLIKWDSLPAFPLPRRNSTVSMSETERGRWRQPQQMQQSQRQSRGRGPAFEHPLPTLYQSEVPVSMAKMIMSRHTFRRPSSRPPPVRDTKGPQYQRKLPSMV